MEPDDYARELAALSRAGHSSYLMPAIVARDHPDDAHAASIARKVTLGASLAQAIASIQASTQSTRLTQWSSEGRVLAAVLQLAGGFGGDLARALDGFAAEIETRRGAQQHAAAQVAGIALSAKLVAFLPLLFAPLTVGTGAPMFDRVGLLLLASGISLTVVGNRWLTGLVPRPPGEPDRATTVAMLLSICARAGADVSTVMGSPATQALLGADAGSIRRRVRLGLSWARSLERSDDPGLASLGAAMVAAEELGLPLAVRLDGFRRARAARLQRCFEAEVRRAPVRMVIPLTVCILPAFVVIGAGPFLRSLAGL